MSFFLAKKVNLFVTNAVQKPRTCAFLSRDQTLNFFSAKKNYSHYEIESSITGSLGSASCSSLGSASCSSLGSASCNSLGSASCSSLGSASCHVRVFQRSVVSEASEPIGLVVLSLQSPLFRQLHNNNNNN